MNRILFISLFSILTLNVMAQEKIVQTAGRDQLGDFAPKFAELNDDVLFGQVWSRTDRLGPVSYTHLNLAKVEVAGPSPVFRSETFERKGNKKKETLCINDM